MTDYRDGKVHHVGPLTVQHRGENVTGLELASCTIRSTKGALYLLDFLYAETLAIALRSFPDLFTVTESDKHKLPNEQGRRRGFLRLRASSDTRRHGRLASASRNEIYQLGRIITDASDEEEVQPIDFSDEGRRDYRRASLKREFSARAKTRTRLAFVEGICWRIGELHGDRAAEVMHRELLARFIAADAETGDPRVIVVTPRGTAA